MSTLLILRGIPASSKSTFALAWVAEQSERRFRSNRDDLRSMLGMQPLGSYEQEQRVTEWQRKIATSYLNEGWDVVLDDTNLRAKHLREWLVLARTLKVDVQFKDFPIELDEAIARDYERGLSGERSVGEEVIRTFYSRYIQKGKLPAIPILPEDEIAATAFAPYVETAGLPHCILVDVDGTLAHIVDRSPYDPTLYHTDIFDEKVGLVAESYQRATGCKIFVFSGRDEMYKDATAVWLGKHYFDYDDLIMRPASDKRNDAIVKNEMFEKHIAGKYNVDFILDDRVRVVNMFRSKGLKVLQVEPGDF